MMAILVFSDDDTDDDRGKWQAAYDFLFVFSIGGDDSTYWWHQPSYSASSPG